MLTSFLVNGTPYTILPCGWLMYLTWEHADDPHNKYAENESILRIDLGLYQVLLVPEKSKNLSQFCLLLFINYIN